MTNYIEIKLKLYNETNKKVIQLYISFDQLLFYYIIFDLAVKSLYFI
jgi:hypothetical protein